MPTWRSTAPRTKAATAPASTTPRWTPTCSQRKLVENDLRIAIERNELRVAYQPIVNNSGETVVGVEALCRWTHPVRGEISPAEFIPIAENSGLIIELGEWVLRRACIDGNSANGPVPASSNRTSARWPAPYESSPPWPDATSGTSTRNTPPRVAWSGPQPSA